MSIFASFGVVSSYGERIRHEAARIKLELGSTTVEPIDYCQPDHPSESHPGSGGNSKVSGTGLLSGGLHVLR